MCESETWKADYLHKAFPDCKFIFSDMHDLGTGRAHDIISGKKVEVPEVTGLCFRICQNLCFASCVFVAFCCKLYA